MVTFAEKFQTLMIDKIGSEYLSYIYMLIYNLSIFSGNILVNQYHHQYLSFPFVMASRGASCMIFGFLFNQGSNFDLEIPKEEFNKIFLRISTVGALLLCRFAMF